MTPTTPAEIAEFVAGLRELRLETQTCCPSIASLVGRFLQALTIIEQQAAELATLRKIKEAAEAWAKYHGCDDGCSGDVCETCAIKFAADAIRAGRGPEGGGR